MRMLPDGLGETRTRAILLAGGLALLALALAGCVGQTAPPVSEVETSEEGAPASPAQADPASAPAYETSCPPGDTQENEQGVCVASIRRVDRSLQEPFVAVDPADPDRIALGVNAGQTHGVVDERAPTHGAYASRLDVLLSTDGGETWSLERLPPIPAEREAVSTVDPTLVWGDEGVLHVAGQVTHRVGATGAEISPFHTARDPDEGWSQPTTFDTDGDVDRPWLTRGEDGTLFLVWSEFGRSGSADVAWSADGGQTWSQTPVPDACSTAGPVRPTSRGPVFACSGAQLYRLDTADRSLTSLPGPDLGQGLFPVVVSPTPDRLVVLAGDGDTVRASATTGPGWNWSSAIDLADTVDTVDGWRPLELYAWEAGPEGGVHVLLSAAGTTRSTSPDPVMGNRHVAYAVLDPDLTNVTTDRALQLADPDPSDHRLPPTAAALSAGDHYYGLDLVDGEGWAAWTRDRGIDLTRLVRANG